MELNKRKKKLVIEKDELIVEFILSMKDKEYDEGYIGQCLADLIPLIHEIEEA